MLSFVYAILPDLTFLALVAAGGLLAERAGIGMLCLEGLALFGSLIAVIGAHVTGTWVGGVFLGIIGGVVLAGLHAALVIRYGVNHLVSALVINFATGPLCLWLVSATFDASSGRTPSIPAAARVLDISVTKDIALSPFLVLALLIFGAVWLVFAERTRLSSAIVASGHSREEAIRAGIAVERLRACCVVIGGALCGLAGTYLAIGFLDIHQKQMTAGLGYLGVAAIVCGGWQPRRVFLACVLLAMVKAASTMPELAVNLGGAAHPVPYVVAILYLALRPQQLSSIPKELFASYRPSPRAQLRRLGVILATGRRRDLSLNSYLLNSIDISPALGIPRTLISRPRFPGESLTTVLYFLRQLSRSHTHIVGLGGFMMGPFSEFAKDPRYRGLRLAVVDGDSGTPQAQNSQVTGILFKEDVYSKPAGYVAAGIANAFGSKGVAFLGGGNVPAVQRWASGFEQGVRCFNESHNGKTTPIEFQAEYLGTNLQAFSDDVGAFHTTEYLVSRRNVIVIAQACGAASIGVFRAVRDARMRGQDVFVISTDLLVDEPYVAFAVLRPLELAIKSWVEDGDRQRFVTPTVYESNEVFVEGRGWNEVGSRLGFAHFRDALDDAQRGTR